MHCPYCNDELTIRDEGLFCKTGNCCFSKHIQKRFEEKIYNTKKFQANKVMRNNKEGHFYCVNCGNMMKKLEQFHELCICCGFEIDTTMYQEIIELNPHCSY